MGPFLHRTEAGRILAKRLLSYSRTSQRRPLVLALPRGGVPVAAEIARALFSTLDLLPVKRVGSPRDSEVALGAVTEQGNPLFNAEELAGSGIDETEANRLAEEKRSELVGEMAPMRREFASLPLEGRHVILVDDGLATGASMEAAIQAVRGRGVKTVTVAAPVTSPEAYLRLHEQVEDFFTLVTPHEFFSVGSWYQDFPSVTDQEVRALLRKFGRPSRAVPVEAIVHEVAVAPCAKGSVGEALQAIAHSLDPDSALLELAEKLSGRRVVMLGESTHGTREFYEIRRKLTEILLERNGFSFVATEGDWPDFQNVNRWLRGSRREASATEILRGFDRWPTWMWANREVVPLLEAPAMRGKSIYGLDIYSLFDSLHQVVGYAKRMGVPYSARLLERYACLEPFAPDEISYARSLLQFPKGCEEEVVGALRELVNVRLQQIGLSENDLFDAQQNARIISNAEKYYRAMLGEGPESWNIRDHHMFDTLEVLLRRAGPEAKAIVWAHNTHVGDHRQTDMREQGLVNLGGIARLKLGEDQVALVGFGTHGGNVTAGAGWGQAEEIMALPPARSGSWDRQLHAFCAEQRWSGLWAWFDTESRNGPLAQRLGQRAVGVVYKPAFELSGQNYVATSLSRRYDAFVFVDHSAALSSLHAKPDLREVPEAWPTGL